MTFWRLHVIIVKMWRKLTMFADIYREASVEKYMQIKIDARRLKKLTIH